MNTDFLEKTEIISVNPCKLTPLNLLRRSGDYNGVQISGYTNDSTVIPSAARNPGYLIMLANRSVSGIPFDTIFDRRACFTSLALHAYGDAAFRMTLMTLLQKATK